MLDRMSYQRFCPVQDVDEQLHRHGHIARGGQVIDATLVPAPRQPISKDDRHRHRHRFDAVQDRRNTGKEVNAGKAYPSTQSL